jgi:outer membrane protein OmpA-like peptidoglycan-associated protein
MKQIIVLLILLCSQLLYGQSTKGLLKIEVQNSKRNTPIANARVLVVYNEYKNDTLTVDSNGMALIEIELGSNVELMGMADDHYDSKTVPLKMDSIFHHVILSCSEFLITNVLELPVFYFKKNGVELTDESIQVLDSVITHFLDKPSRSFIIELNGHTRPMKSFEKSFNLGLERANRIKELIKQKLPYKHTIVASSYAYSRLINSCERGKCSEEELSMHDRVVFRLVARCK